MRVAANFHEQVYATSCHSNFEIHRVMTEQLLNALKAIETLALDMMKVYGLPVARAISFRLSRPWPSGSP